MKNKNLIVITLVISVLLISSMFSGTAINIGATNYNGNFVVEKEVYDGEFWVDEIDAVMDEIVSFKITITYHETDHPNAHYCTNFHIADTLPPCLDYVIDSATLNGVPMEPDIDGNVLFWNLTHYDYYLEDGESHVIEFDCQVIEYGENINVVDATAQETCSGTPFQGASSATVNVPQLGPGEMLCDKKVWDDNIGGWVDEIDAYVGDYVRFKITIEYHGDSTLSNFVIKDTLPPCLEYANNAVPPETDMDGNKIYWNLTDTLNDGESLEITFKTLVISTGENINVVDVAAEECGFDTLECQSQAIVNAEIEADPGIDVEKKVWDGICDWVDTVYAKNGEIVRFNITVRNTGNIPLINVYVNDTLSDSLGYENNAIPFEPTITMSGKHLSWYFEVLEVGETIYIEFDAIVEGAPCSEDINWVDVVGHYGCGDSVTDRDSATVKIEGLCMEKEVWDEDLGAWMEETTAGVGDTVRFRIITYYYGDYKLYNIKIRDVLPDCLIYADNAIPEEPEISGQTLWWNLSNDLYDGDSLVVEFDAEITEEGLCEDCINWAYIIANECSGSILTWQDPATVNVECTIVADAGGPYTGDIDETITITGDASGGIPPYSYEWDLDNDGEFDDATGKTIAHSWDEAGEYIVWVLVTDDDGAEDDDYAYVHIAPEDNDPPAKPSRPDGPAKAKRGTNCKYNTSTTDPNGDQVMYMFDWGDGSNSGWLGPYDSGAECEASHKWTSQGSFSIKVKAQDTFFEESEWSDPFGVSMPKSKLLLNPMFARLFERLIERFPILEKILGI